MCVGPRYLPLMLTFTKRHRPRKATKGSQAAPLWMRFALLALVMVQVVAPTWHVCALGGNAGAHSGHAHSQQGETKPAAGMLCIPAGEDAPSTNITQALEKAATFVSASITEPCDNCATTCLARMLMGMSGGIAVSQNLAYASVEQAAPARPAIRLVSLSTLPQPPSRGPPARSAA